jgi:hypothetical protein
MTALYFPYRLAVTVLENGAAATLHWRRTEERANLIVSVAAVAEFLWNLFARFHDPPYLRQ